MRRLHLRPWAAILIASASLLPAGADCAEPFAANLPLRRDAEPDAGGGPWLPSALLLGLAVAAGGYAVWRRGPGAQRPAAGRRVDAGVTRLSSQALTPHASVHAVQWQGEEFLLACTPQQVTVLARRSVAQETGAAP